MPGEDRAPDSIQFNLVDMNDKETDTFVQAAEAAGVKVQVFGRSTDNARAYWNWQFVDDLPELPRTCAMLMRACDVRLPVRLNRVELDAVADVLLAAVAEAKSSDTAILA